MTRGHNCDLSSLRIADIPVGLNCKNMEKLRTRGARVCIPVAKAKIPSTTSNCISRVTIQRRRPNCICRKSRNTMTLPPPRLGVHNLTWNIYWILRATCWIKTLRVQIGSIGSKFNLTPANYVTTFSSDSTWYQNITLSSIFTCVR